MIIASGVIPVWLLARHFKLSGRLQIRSWTDKDGNKRKNAEIVADNVYFGDSKQDSGNQNSGFTGFVKAESVPSNNNFAVIEDDDAQLPF